MSLKPVARENGHRTHREQRRDSRRRRAGTYFARSLEPFPARLLDGNRVVSFNNEV
jgi:hypothetical protein